MGLRYLFYRFGFLLFAVLSVGTTIAQNEDAPARPIKASDYPKFSFSPAIEGEPADTTLDFFHRYIPGPHLGMASAGNIGLAVTPLMFSPDTQTLGWNFERLGCWRVQDKAIEYAALKRPYTDAFFGAGANNQQFLNAQHFQRIRKGWHAGVGLNVFGTDGFYSNQKTGYSHFRFLMDYRAPNGAYAGWGNIVYTKLSNGENGGIADLTRFEEPETLNRAGLAANLSSAQSVFEETAINYHQWWQVRGMKVDSIYEVEQSALRIYHDVHAARTKSWYDDPSPDSAYYAFLFPEADSTVVFDSLMLQRVENTVGLEWRAGSASQWHVRAGVKHLLLDQRQNARIRTWQQVELQARSEYRASDSVGLRFRLEGNYCFAGYNQGGYMLRAQLEKHNADQTAAWRLGIRHSEQLPGIVYARFRSDFLSWTNEFLFNSMTTLRVERTDSDLHYAVGLSGTVQSRMPYFGTDGLPAQASTQQQIVQGWLRKHFKHRALNWRINVLYQNALGSELIRVPEWTAQSSLWVEKRIFRQKMLAQLGADASIHTSYKANAYLPLTRQFYLQDSISVGNYPFIDVFVAFKVQRVRVFAKLSHAFEGLLGYEYSMLPGHPQPGRFFGFGLHWMFFD